MVQLTSAQVWQVIEKEMFAVLGMVTAKHEARTVGIVYIVHQRKLYIGSQKSAWKTRHIAQNPHVSLTIPIAKRIFFLPWIKIPAATITFSGEAHILEPSETSPEVIQALFRGMDITAADSPPFAIIEVIPQNDFLTYGVGVSLMSMRNPDLARGRAPVG